MNKYESILRLTCPKLLSNTVNFSNMANGKAAIGVKDQPSQSAFVHQTIDNSSLHYKSVDALDGKKNKLRQKKKVKNRSSAEKDMSRTKHQILHSLDSINFARSAKNVKSKQDIKNDHLKSVEQLNEHEAVNEIHLSDLLTVNELAGKLNIPSADIIKWLFLQGISVTINQLLDVSISTLVAEHYSFSVLKKRVVSEMATSNIPASQNGRSRAPVVTLLGHVDHGKTTLLQAIRQDDCLIQEAGNITQSIGSYEIQVENKGPGSKLIFLDTPGHEAFTDMRKRGASITDLALLVVSADDGLKPQTIEAINYVKASNLPFLVAINKIDKPEANISKVKDQLLDFNIQDGGMGKNSNIVPVSALTGQNIDLLLSCITALSKAQNLKSDPSIGAEGIILEAHLDKRKGPVAQLLVRNGTLRVGDILLAGNLYGKVKAITSSLNQKMTSIESAALADVLCFTEVPSPGLFFKTVSSEKKAKTLAATYIKSNAFTALNARISLDDVTQKHPKTIIKQLNLIIKTSSQGSIDAITYALSRLPQEKVQVNLLLVASGEVSLKDVELAYASNSLIAVFSLNISSTILQAAEKRAVNIQAFSIIYDLIDSIKSYMLEFVDLDYEKQILGYAEVKDLFAINKWIVAGCFIKNGKLKKESCFQVKRSGQIIYTGLIDSLKRLKDDVDEVSEGNECGVMCRKYSMWEIGDLLECYNLKPLEKTL